MSAILTQQRNAADGANIQFRDTVCNLPQPSVARVNMAEAMKSF